MKRLSAGLSFWIVAAFTSVMAVAPTDSNHIPFRLHHHLIVVKGSIGGLKNLDLVIDTGANVSVVDRGIAKRLRLEPVSHTPAVSLDQTRQLQQVVLSELQFGPVSMKSVRVLVEDLSFFGAGSSVDAIVGIDVLSENSFGINYAAKKISLDSVDFCDSSIPLETGFPVPVVLIHVGEVRLRMLVDTGGHDLVLFENRIQNRLRGTIRMQSEYALDHAGGRSRVKKALLRQVRIGDARPEKARAYLLEVPDHAYPGLDGILGPFSLGAKRIQFDFKEGVLGWDR